MSFRVQPRHRLTGSLRARRSCYHPGISSRPFSDLRADGSGRRQYQFLAEPAGPAYRALVAAALDRCTHGAVLVDHRPPAPPGRRVLDGLRSHVTSVTSTGQGIVMRFRLDQESAAILAGGAGGLYRWRAPELPENLSFLRGDGTPWLVSAAAAGVGLLELTPFEKLLLERHAPAVAELLDRYGGAETVSAALERCLGRELTRVAEAIIAEARRLGEDRGAGLIAVLSRWLGSDDPTRVRLALDVVAALGIDDLIDDVADLRADVAAGQRPVVAGGVSNPALDRAAAEQLLGRIDTVLARLSPSWMVPATSPVSGPPGAPPARAAR